MQLRAAEARRHELERAHADAVASLRGCGPDMLEANQSRVRELEKKVALETVRYVSLYFFSLSLSHSLFFYRKFKRQFFKLTGIKRKSIYKIIDAKNSNWNWHRRKEIERKLIQLIRQQLDNRGVRKELK